MTEHPVIAWAAARDGIIWAGSVRITRREVAQFMPEFAISASDYNRLSPKAQLAKARKNGWRLVKVSIARVRP